MTIGDTQIPEEDVCESEILLTTKDSFTMVAEELYDDLLNELPFVVKKT